MFEEMSTEELDNVEGGSTIGNIGAGLIVAAVCTGNIGLAVAGGACLVAEGFGY